MIDMQLQDATLTCIECGQAFTLTGGQLVSYQRGGQAKPSRCPFCRAARMIAGGPRNATGNSTPGEHSGQSMYSAVCSQCGKTTRVPFEPHAHRPVYCSDCYRLQRERSGGGYDGSRSRTASYHRT
jgi:CxxC-x17-CxxC domain-containing protein